MNATAPPAGDLYLVVGYDGSPPAARALDAAIRLLYGRAGTIVVVYVAHLPSIDSLSPGAVEEMEVTFDDISQELHASARASSTPTPATPWQSRSGAHRMPCTVWSARLPSAWPAAQRCPS
jgi:nucleotide-binding universal stress UspA family protein